MKGLLLLSTMVLCVSCAWPVVINGKNVSGQEPTVKLAPLSLPPR